MRQRELLEQLGQEAQQLVQQSHRDHGEFEMTEQTDEGGILLA